MYHKLWKGSDRLATKYPMILVHGVAAKQWRIINAFGRIGHKLADAGYTVFVADTDGFGSIETNAEQLKRYVLSVLKECKVKKVNIIAHSKGGLDGKYMITHLGMEEHVASLTTLCTPHKGSIIASKIWDMPLFVKKTIAFFINFTYKYFLGDENPDAMRTCEQLRSVDESSETLCFSKKVYCQSYSAELHRARDCFVMALPMKLYKHYENTENDGLVARESTKFGNFRGSCLDSSVSHVQIIDLFSKKSQKEKIYSFYISLCDSLSNMGF